MDHDSTVMSRVTRNSLFDFVGIVNCHEHMSACIFKLANTILVQKFFSVADLLTNDKCDKNSVETLFATDAC